MPEAGMPSSLEGRLFRLGINTPVWLMIPLALLATVLLPLAIGYAADLFSSQQLGGPDMKSSGIVFALIGGCVVAPLAETAVNEWGCITLLRKNWAPAPGGP